jgi:hypothetical protein
MVTKQTLIYIVGAIIAIVIVYYIASPKSMPRLKQSVFIGILLIATGLIIYLLRDPNPLLEGVGRKVKPYVLNYPKGNNYLNIHVDPNPANNFFIVMGDWGGTAVGHKDAQYAVADMLKRYLDDNSHLNLLFLATLGDNFYYTGQNGKLWDIDWHKVYDPRLLAVPWLAVMGNHDWGKNDAWCLCPEGNPHAKEINGTKYYCNLLNEDKGRPRPSYTKNFHLPDFCHNYRIDELEFELLAISADYIDAPKGIGGSGIEPGHGGYQTNKNCEKAGINLVDKLQAIFEAGLNMLYDRAKNSTNKNILITDHYHIHKVPKVGVPACEEFRNLFLKHSPIASKQTVICAGGHIHTTGCIKMQGKCCVNILAGGGGGCCSKKPEDKHNGFYVIRFDKNKNMYTEQITYPYHTSASLGFENTEPPSEPPCSPDVHDEDSCVYERELEDSFDNQHE